MARRRRQRKMEPTELTLNFQLVGDTGFSQYIDIAQCLSALNRKFYRQGYEYAIQGVELISNDDCTCLITRINRNWPVYNSWVKAYSLWKKQQDETMDESGLSDTTAKYRDFKVYMDGEQRMVDPVTVPYATTFADGNLKPMNVMTLADATVIDPLVKYEWNYSDVAIPNDGTVGVTNEYNLHMIGDDVNPLIYRGKGIIKAYADSRARPMQNDPNIVNALDGGLFGQMFDDGDDSEEIIQNTQYQNNQPPYLNSETPSAEEFYPGSVNNPTGTLEYNLATSATTGRLVSSYGGSSLAPLGLLQVIHTLAEGDSGWLRIHLAPGAYKGVMALPMKDVN